MGKNILGLLAAMAVATTGASGARAETAGYAQPSQPITVIALAKVKPGSEPAFRAAVARILAPTRAEKGNFSYVYHQSTEASNEFAFIESWDSTETLAAHLKTPHMQAFFAEAGPLFEPGYPEIKQFVRIDE